MRVRNAADGLSVHAIAGTNVVLFGLDIDPGEIEDLLGFEIERTGGGGKERYLYGGMQFRDGPKAAGAFPDSRTAPIQAFLWGDYEAKSGTKYTYTIRARYGTPREMEIKRAATVQVTTENPTRGVHGVYFNRGVAGSDAYNRRFDEHRCFYLLEKYGRARWTPFIRPDQVPGDAAWNWLSRGLKEALLEFIGQADGPRYALRVAAYELDYLPVLAALARALEAQVDVQIVHHAKQVRRQELRRGGKTVEVVSLDPVGLSAQAAIRRVGIKEWPNTTRWQKAFFDRTDTTISHNKFIVLLKDNEPVAVWTGFDQLHGRWDLRPVQRRAHREGQGCRRPLSRLLEQAEDRPAPQQAGIREGQAEHVRLERPDATRPDRRPGTRLDRDDLQPAPEYRHAQVVCRPAGGATSSVHFTAAFGVSQPIAAHLATPAPTGTAASYLRYIMLESLPPQAAAKVKDEATAGGKPVPVAYSDYKDLACNRIAWGDLMENEVLSGLNLNVDYLHTKFMLIDPLTDDPTVITGSANFSDNSTTMNDENMLVIRGDKRVAEIYLTEFMRLFNHFRHRNEVNALPPERAASAKILADDESWTRPYFKRGTKECAERLLFRGT